jgi:hypothetical protein
MGLHRRAVLGAIGVGAAGATTLAQAQTTTPPAAPTQTATERIAERALQNRHRLDYSNGVFSGPAWDLMVREGNAAHAFLIGEEHGIAENPKLAAQLFAALRSSGYAHLAVEISPPMAAHLDRAARAGVDGVRAMFADRASNVAFFGMREEAEWIADARAAVPGRAPMLWGLDYEVSGYRRLITDLKAKRKPRAAEAELARLEAASNASVARYEETHNPQFIFSFSGDPELVRAVRAAWPRADDEALWMLETLEETLEINKLWVAGQGHASNVRRADFNKRNLRRYWRTAQDQKVFYKFGASHMVRGLSHTWSFDIGTMAAELAHLAGGKSFHMLVLPGATSPHAQFDPSAWTYRPATDGTYTTGPLALLIQAAFTDAMTLIDLRPLRSSATGQRSAQLPDELVRTVHGFDAALVMTGSTASSNL